MGPPGEYRISVASPDGSGDVMWNGCAESTEDALNMLLLELEMHDGAEA
jgi:hypothetical protein